MEEDMKEYFQQSGSWNTIDLEIKVTSNSYIFRPPGNKYNVPVGITSLGSLRQRPPAHVTC